MAFDHRHAAAGDITLHTAAQAAAAVEQRQAVALQQVGRHAPVAPFAGQTVEAADQPALHAETAARAGAEDGAEHAGVAIGCAAMCFGQGKALQVVAEAQRTLQACLQILRHALAGERRHVGTELAPRATVAHAGQGDTDGRGRVAEFGVGAFNQFLHGLQECGVVALRRGDALAPRHLHGGIAGHQFNLGAADVDAVTGVWRGLSHGGWSRL
ncbi:hypothetical protein D3C71_1445510 [compost metagenome]